MDELLKKLVCFGCPYGDDCKDEWEEGHSHCDEMMNNAKAFLDRMVKNLKFSGNDEDIAELKEKYTAKKMCKPNPNIYCCPECGEEIQPMWSYCPWCGQHVTDS